MPKWLKNLLIIIASLIIAGVWGGVTAFLGVPTMITAIVVVIIGGVAVGLIADKNSN